MLDNCIDHGQKGTPAGYGSLELHKRATSAHRVAYMKKHGLTHSDIAGQVVRHKCDNPRCVNPDHLELGTYKENTADMDKRGRAKRPIKKGADANKAVLTDAQVIEMRQLWNSGVLYLKDIAARFGVGISTVRSAVSGKNWKHIPLLEAPRIGRVGGRHTKNPTEWNGAKK